jgi:O-antigen/teichoic acid export membrane protein
LAAKLVLRQTAQAGEPDVLDSSEAGSAVIRGGAVRTVGFAVGLGVSVVSSAVLLRYLGPSSFAHYITIVSLVTLAAGITDAGLSAIGVRELSTLEPVAARRLFGNLFGIRMLLSALGVVIAVCFALLAYSPTLVIGALVAGAAVLLQTSQDTFAIPLQAQLRFGLVTGVDAVRQTVTAIAIVALVVIGAPLTPFWAAAAAGGLMATVAAALLVRRTVPLVPALDRKVWGPLLRDTLPYAMAAAVGAIYYRVAILVMSLVASTTQTGYFGASFRVVEVLLVVPQILVGATFPLVARAARDDTHRLNYALGRMLDVCLLGGLAVGLGVVAGAPFIIKVIAGPKFAPAAGVLRIQGLALVGSFVAAVFSYGLLALHRYRATLVVNVSVLALSAVLTGVLAAADGAHGAAVSVVVVELVYVVMLGLAVRRTGTRPRVAAVVAPRALLAAGLGALALLPPNLPDVLRPVIALCIYGGVLLALGAVPDEVLEEVRGLRRRRAVS